MRRNSGKPAHESVAYTFLIPSILSRVIFQLTSAPFPLFFLYRQLVEESGDLFLLPVDQKKGPSDQFVASKGSMLGEDAIKFLQPCTKGMHSSAWISDPLPPFILLLWSGQPSQCSTPLHDSNFSLLIKRFQALASNTSSAQFFTLKSAGLCKGTICLLSHQLYSITRTKVPMHRN